MNKNQLNLIFITIDGARSDRVSKGKNFSNLINKSRFFSKVITYAPFTIAAMHAVFSGTYGTKTGVDSYWSNIDFKKNEFKTLTKYLNDDGYLTHADIINKLILPSDGFDKFDIHDELHDDLTKKHLELLKKYSQMKKPFFLYLHYSNIHTGIMENVLKKYNNFSKTYFENKEKNEIFYDKLFSSADEYLGKIISECENLGLDKNSLIVVISDHGISVGEKFGERAYGVYCYDYTLITSAFFINYEFSAIKINKQVRSIDILPTILEILKIPIDRKYKKFQGESLTPYFNGDDSSRIAFSQSGNPLESNKPPLKPNVWAIRTDQWKFIINIHNSTEELYNLTDDPLEENNLILKEKTIGDELRFKLKSIMNS